LVVTVEGTIATPTAIFVVRLMSEVMSFGWIYAYLCEQPSDSGALGTVKGKRITALDGRTVVCRKVTFHEKKMGTWSEAVIISDSLGINDEVRLRAYLDMQRLEDYSLFRGRTITKIERLEEKESLGALLA
jgi:hypothetical protein